MDWLIVLFTIFSGVSVFVFNLIKPKYKTEPKRKIKKRAMLYAVFVSVLVLAIGKLIDSDMLQRKLLTRFFQEEIQSMPQSLETQKAKNTDDIAVSKSEQPAIGKALPTTTESKRPNGLKDSRAKTKYTIKIFVGLDRNGAGVFIDDKLVGAAPCTLQVVEGEHQLKVVYENDVYRFKDIAIKTIYVSGSSPKIYHFHSSSFQRMRMEGNQ